MRRFAPLFFALLLLFQWRGLAQGNSISPQKMEAVDRAMRAEMEKQNVTGLAIGILQNGRIAYLNGYGWADKTNEIPVGPKTLFRWASISKTLTAVATFRLVESGKLDINADARIYVPEFPNKGVPITARDLLCHQSGLPHYNKGKVVASRRVYDVEHPFEDVVTALDTFKDSPLIFPPGEQFSYSSYGYILLSAIVQRAGQQNFNEQVQQRIATPLGMTTLQPDYEWKTIPNRAVGYVESDGKIGESTDTDVSWKLGAGGYISNIEDLARFAQGLLQGQLLKQQTYATMWQPQKTKDGELAPWGLGFVVQTDSANRFKVSHDGGQEKARCRMVLYPNLKHGVVVMSNSENAEPAKFSTAIYAILAS